MLAYELAHNSKLISANMRAVPKRPTKEEIECALEQILRSHVFSRARRMCRLLRYLVEQGIAGAKRNTCEYAIGLDVFDREPAEYYPGNDPVVRIQVGRLRQRLAEFYACFPNQVQVHLSIPLGTYWPEFNYVEPGAVRTHPGFEQGLMASDLHRDEAFEPALLN